MRLLYSTESGEIISQGDLPASACGDGQGIMEVPFNPPPGFPTGWRVEGIYLLAPGGGVCMPGRVVEWSSPPPPPPPPNATPPAEPAAAPARRPSKTRSAKSRKKT